jgi:hypothetical protein
MAGMPQNRLCSKEYLVQFGARKNFNRCLEWKNGDTVNVEAWMVGSFFKCWEALGRGPKMA